MIFKMRHIKESGSLTVEAAFIMPIAVFSIIAVIILAFYLHDYCQIQGSVNKVLFKAGMSVKHEADIATGRVSYEAINMRGIFYPMIGSTNSEEGKILQLLNTELGYGLSMTRITNTEVETGTFGISISVNAEAMVAVPYLYRLLGGLLKIHIKGFHPIHNPAETIRCAEVILDTGSEIKGIEDLKKLIKSFQGSK